MCLWQNNHLHWQRRYENGISKERKEMKKPMKKAVKKAAVKKAVKKMAAKKKSY